MLRARTSLVTAASVFVTSTAVAQFTDVTATSGLAVVGTRDGGGCFADVDRDGDYDAYVPRAAGSALLINNGAGVFEDRTAAAIAGLTGRSAYRGCALGDVDNDGDIDLVRTGPRVLEVYLNRQGDGGALAFGNASQGPDFFIDGQDGIPDPFATNFEGLGILDYNADGLLDFAVQNEGGVRLFANQGAGSFSPADGTGLPAGAGQGDYLTVADIDGDGDSDILARLVGDGDLFMNDGDGTFTEISPNLPADPDDKGGALVCDFDNDGQFDLFFSDGVEGPLVNRVLLQEDGRFTATTTPDLAGSVEGAACGDVDHDGDVDLIVNLITSTQLFVNQLAEAGSFDLVRDDRGLTRVESGRSVSLSDVDGDGDLDAFVTGTGPRIAGTVNDFEPGSNALFQNGVDDDRYLHVRPLADVGACPSGRILREDIGAIVQVLDDSGNLLATREISGGAGRGRMEAPIAHFGLPAGPALTYRVRVRFLYGGGDVTLPVVPATLGSPQRLDVITSDPDGDAIPTDVEMEDATVNPDLDGDGVAAWLDVDSDGDGLPDALEAGDDDPCTAPVDADSNGVPDYLEATAPVDAGVPVDAGMPGDGGAPADAGPGPGLDASPGPPNGEVLLDGATEGIELKGGGIASCNAARSLQSVGYDGGLLVLALWLGRRWKRRFQAPPHT